MSWILIFTTIAVLLTGGTVYAADWAAPGDPLYIVDRSVESVRLELARDPEQALHLQLTFATERLDEAETLTSAKDFDNLQEAFRNYGALMAQVANSIHRVENGEKEGLQARVTQTFRLHEGLLDRIFQEEGAPDDDRIGVC